MSLSYVTQRFVIVICTDHILHDPQEYGYIFSGLQKQTASRIAHTCALVHQTTSKVVLTFLSLFSLQASVTCANLTVVLYPHSIPECYFVP